MRWFVYTLADPRDGRVRYVGETGGNLRERLYGHVSDALHGARHGQRNPKRDWILGLRAEGLAPEIRAVDWYVRRPSKQARSGLERQWIDAFLEAGADLFNVQKHPTAAGRVNSESARRGWARRRAAESCTA